jgi:hypothetical protein
MVDLLFHERREGRAARGECHARQSEEAEDHNQSPRVDALLESQGWLPGWINDSIRETVLKKLKAAGK